MKILSIFICMVILSAILIRADEAVLVDSKPSAGDTGNMHYLESVSFRLGEGASAIIKTDLEKGVLAPKIFLTKKTGDQNAIAFGWSSWGGGTENLHVILLEHTSDGTKITDQLIMQTRRGPETGGFIWSDENVLFAVAPKMSKDEMAHTFDGNAPFISSSFGKITYDQAAQLRFGPPPSKGSLIENDGAPFEMNEKVIPLTPAFAQRRTLPLPISNGKIKLPQPE